MNGWSEKLGAEHEEKETGKRYKRYMMNYIMDGKKDCHAVCTWSHLDATSSRHCGWYWRTQRTKDDTKQCLRPNAPWNPPVVEGEKTRPWSLLLSSFPAFRARIPAECRSCPRLIRSDNKNKGMTAITCMYVRVEKQHQSTHTYPGSILASFCFLIFLNQLALYIHVYLFSGEGSGKNSAYRINFAQQGEHLLFLLRVCSNDRAADRPSSFDLSFSSYFLYL